MNTTTAISKGFDIIAAILGDCPDEPFSLSTRGGKGQVSVPMSSSPAGLVQTGLAFRFRGDWIEIHYSV